MIDSNTASDSCLFSITAFSFSGKLPSLEKLICKGTIAAYWHINLLKDRQNPLTHSDPRGDWVKQMDASGGKVSFLKISWNLLVASDSAWPKVPIAFQYATQFSTTFSEYFWPVNGKIILTCVNFSKGPIKYAETWATENKWQHMICNQEKYKCEDDQWRCP